MSPRKSSRLHRFLLLTKATVLLACALCVTSVQVSEKIPANRAASEPDASKATVPEFVATNTWQELLPGQGVPQGLHVRLNLETGKREAKLVDPNDQDTHEFMRSVVVAPSAKETTVTVSTGISGDIVSDYDTLTVTDEEGIIAVIASTESTNEEEAETEVVEPNWNHEKIYDVLQALPEPPKVEGMDIHEVHEKLSPAEFCQQIITLWKKRQAELKEALESLQDDAKHSLSHNGKLLKWTHFAK